MTVNLDPRNPLKTSPRRRRPAAAGWLAGLALLAVFGLIAHFALEATQLPATAQAGVTFPAADSLLGDDALDDGLLPTLRPAELPRPPRCFSLSTVLLPLSAAPRPVPHPPQLPAA